MSLVPVDTSSELAVSDYLSRARDWLATAVEKTGPAEIAAAKAEIATAAEATKQLGLSKEIQEDAVEMVRRAEYALGRAIRKGQAEGTVTTRSDGGWPAHREVLRGESTKNRPTDFAPLHELTGGGNGAGIYGLTDGVAPEQFEAALEDAKGEGNLSRANVLRKVKGIDSPAKPLSRQQKADLIADLAEQGYSSSQMAERVGVTVERIREIARAYDIEITADRVMGRGSQHIDHTAAVDSAVTRLEHLVAALKYIDLAEVDRSQTDEWTVSLTDSIRALNRFKKQIEETIHVH